MVVGVWVLYGCRCVGALWLWVGECFMVVDAWVLYRCGCVGALWL